MNIEDFEKLGLHLEQVKPIFNLFCKNHDFSHVPKSSIGRYPRIRIDKQEHGLTIWLDLWMEFDNSGKRYKEFFPEIPYELMAGAFFVVNDGFKGNSRYQKSFTCFSNKPFIEVPEVLYEELENNYTILKKWSVDYVKAEGEKIKLRS